MKKFYLQTKHGKILTNIQQRHWEKPEDGEKTFNEHNDDCISDETFIVGDNIVHEAIYDVPYINGIILVRWINGELNEVRNIEGIYDY